MIITVAQPVFILEGGWRNAQVRAILRRLPPVRGRPLRIVIAPGLRDRHGAVHAGSFVRERRIAFNCTRTEFPRVFCHELFHFVWVRASNRLRRQFEELLKAEWLARVPGELGWSAEWRKRELQDADVEGRTRRWREYCCESFCDTAAWLYGGMREHEEFTLATRFRRLRGQWLQAAVESRGLSI